MRALQISVPCGRLLVSRALRTGGGKSRIFPTFGFRVAATGFPKPGTEFSIPGTEKSKPGTEKTNPPIEISIPGTGISIGGVGRHFCCTLPFSLIHLTHGRKTWLKGLKTYAYARVHAYAHTQLLCSQKPFNPSASIRKP